MFSLSSKTSQPENTAEYKGNVIIQIQKFATGIFKRSCDKTKEFAENPVFKLNIVAVPSFQEEPMLTAGMKGERHTGIHHVDIIGIVSAGQQGIQKGIPHRQVVEAEGDIHRQLFGPGEQSHGKNGQPPVFFLKCCDRASSPPETHGDLWHFFV